jgi:hypothetical protein
MLARLSLGFIMATCAIVLGGGSAAADVRDVRELRDVREVQLTPEETIARSAAILGRMEASRVSVEQKLQAARAQRDVVLTLCLNDKLNQLDVAIRGVRERREALSAAAARRDADLLAHEGVIVSVLGQRGDQITAEANLCAGSPTDLFEPSEIKHWVDPDIPPDPSAWEGPSAGVIIEPPACASCVK